MDSGVVHSRVYYEYGQYHPDNVGLQHDHPDSKSVLRKVKAKAKKIKDTITKQGHGHDHEQYHEYRYEDQHIPDDHDLDEEDDDDEDMVEDPEIHGAPIYESAALRSTRPGKVENLCHPRANVGGTTVAGKEHLHKPRVVVVSSIGETTRSTEPAGTFVGEDETRQRQENLDRPMRLEEDPQAPGSRTGAYDPPNYQSKVTDPTGAGTREIDTIPIENSLSRMSIHNEPKPNTVLPIGSGTQYPSTGSHDQFSLGPTSTSTLTNPTIFPEYPQVTRKTICSETHYPSAGSYEQFSLKPKTTPTNPTIFPEYSQASTKTFDTYKPEERPLYETTEKPSTRSSYTYKPEYPNATTQAFGTMSQPGDHPYHETLEKPSTQSSYTDKISSATSAIADKVISAKDVIASKLGYGENGDRYENNMKNEEHKVRAEKPSTQSSYTDKISSATSAIADKAISTKNVVASKLRYGEKGDRDENEMKYEEHKIGTEKPSNKSSYTEKISSATSAIADKAIFAKNVVASKLVYEDKGDEGENDIKHEENKIRADKPSNYSSYTNKISSATSAIADKAVSVKNIVTSKLGYDEKGDIENRETTHVEHKSGDTATKPESTTGYGKKIASTVTGKLAPVYGAVAGVGSAVMSKVPGTGTGASIGSGNETANVVPNQDKGVSVKDYLVEKLRPGDEDRALSEVISGAYYTRKENPVGGPGVKDAPVKKMVKDAIHKREDVSEKADQNRPLGRVTESVEVKRYLGTEKDEKGSKENHVSSPGKGVVDKVKVAVGSLFGKTGETPSTLEVGYSGQGSTVGEEKTL